MPSLRRTLSASRAAGTAVPKRSRICSASPRRSGSTGTSTLGRPISALERGGSSFGGDLPGVDDPDPVGQLICLLEVLGGQKDRHPVLGGKAGDFSPERGTALRVKAGGRLVEKESTWGR